MNRGRQSATSIRANHATGAALIFGTATVYLAALQIGPLAAAVAWVFWTVAVSVAYGRHVDRLHRALERQTRLARVDDLTGLGNDRSFREALETCRIGSALALIDVDHFKAYNDAFGHLAGNRALAEIGKVLVGVAGDSLRAYRVGGDEFAVLLPAGNHPDPIEIAGAIARAVADHPWPLQPITVSVGFARAVEVDASSLLEQADRRLYQAKREGGNRAIVSD